MSRRYLVEHVPQALMALELAEKEAAHLAYTHRTLFGQAIDLEWVKTLQDREDDSEKIDAFVSRFGRLQDHIGGKLIPGFARMLGESPKSMLDILAYAEKMGWMDNADEFLGARKLRNLLVHEYMVEAEVFLDAIHAADKSVPKLLRIVTVMRDYAHHLDLMDSFSPPTDDFRDAE